MEYLSFVLFATALAIAPGPDTLLTLRATVVGGRVRGLWTVLGIGIAGTIQGVLAATGLGAVIRHAEPVFETIRWLGVAYLAWLAFSALRSALTSAGDWTVTGQGKQVKPWAALRTGFLCNITNPKVLAFNLAVLPQFVTPDAGLATLLAYALTLMAVGTVVLLGIVWAAGFAAKHMLRAKVRRTVDGATGVVMLGFAGALALDH